MTEQDAADSAAKVAQDIVSFFEINTEVVARVDGDVVHVDIGSSDANSLLIGRNAETLKSLQHIIVSVLRSNDASIQRVNVDIAGYKKQREEKLAEKARGWIASVQESGEDRSLNLSAADRRIVHGVAQEFDDIETFSEGEGRDRKIVIRQK